MARVRVGVLFRCDGSPETLVAFARRAERLGYDEVWLVEDCFFAGAISSAAAVLASTERITVGIGVLPAVLRNPALTAMELAVLARLFPGRLLPGFGHGVAEWMRQVGAFPDSQLAALGETVMAVRALLGGEQVSMSGRHVRLDGVRLEHRPTVVPPVFTGVRGAKSLRLSGQVADGTILAELSSPGYVSWARNRIDDGRRDAGRTDDHHVRVYTFLDDPDQAEVRQAAARSLRANGPAYGVDERVTDQIRAKLAGTDDDASVEKALPTEYLDQLCVSGAPGACAERIKSLRSAGADAVILVPSADAQRADRQLHTVASEVLARLDSRP